MRSRRTTWVSDIESSCALTCGVHRTSSHEPSSERTTTMPSPYRSSSDPFSPASHSLK